MATSPVTTSTRASRDTIVTASALSKGFGDRQVVSDLSFSVARGRAYGLLGPNGSGKTTTVRMLTGLLTPDQGEVALFGEPVNATSADGLRRRIGVQTDTSLYDTLSARENLRTWGALYGVRPRALNERVDEVLEVLGLSARADSLAGEFSKGMKQKLAIGRAILHQPELLFLDEPTAGLDPEASADLIAYLTQMIRSLNTTVIICTASKSSATTSGSSTPVNCSARAPWRNYYVGAGPTIATPSRSVATSHGLRSSSDRSSTGSQRRDRTVHSRSPRRMPLASPSSSPHSSPSTSRFRLSCR